MNASMTMFRKRFLRDPCPYRSPRIAFLDQDLMSAFTLDFRQFSLSPKKFKFLDFYMEHTNGILPSDSPTGKKWFIDVDNLYGNFFINGNHWVAVDIDLPKKKIYVYDSIPSIVNDKELVKQLHPVSKMIPALLNHVVPNDIRKKCNKQLEVKRVLKGVPKNMNPGDCGVFALKYIECLAGGVSFEGLCDENIQGIREKLAAELYDEVPEPYNSDFIVN